MAADYKYTEAQYQALKEALASGALIVRYEDKLVEYRSIAQMQIILNAMEIELKSVNKTSGVTKQIRMSTTKGF